MELRERLAEALESTSPTATGERLAEVALGALREHIANDTHAAHRVGLFVSLRQSAAETPIQFVRRIVAGWLDEAAPAEEAEAA